MSNFLGPVLKLFAKDNPSQNSTALPVSHNNQLSTNQLKEILDSIDDGVVVINTTKQVVFINRQALGMFGLTEEEVLHKPISQVFEVKENDKLIPDLNYCPIRTDGFVGNLYEKSDIEIKVLKDKKDDTPPVQNPAVTTPQGNSLAIPGVATVSNQKKPSYNLISKQIQNGVQSDIGCVLIVHDNSSEKQLESMKLDFVSMAAHELRTPLTSLKGYLSVFMKESDGKLTPDQQMFLNRMSISTQTLMSLIENLLNVSRVERGAFTMYKEPIDWLKMVKTTVDEYKLRAKEKNISLDFIEPKQPVPQIYADKLRIGEVLYNLISNAINYTAPGGSIQVWIDIEKDYVTTHVKDTGEGIPKEAIPHLFTKFFRVSGNLEQGSKGTGLGLYICKSIIDVHQGKIWVESELGKGSIFSFSIPIAKDMHQDITTGSILK